ncbi:DNA repair exonuclease [Cytobacillus horneckiae]|uniref:DNA repair exonuclease n=1 Tax=Cytobacillus horneckiae TaxID=549687 RepID=A0A2N0Z935_9BACI|nr:DNA repair exonuclease [Cytobacillus horneckiae]MEC1158191.1 DNA repair exonuclease [Cytobacillus horneckiae]MED2940165.1 DNA repair exonuclease [Cytobacillus horneckiae]PKG26000.1 DNA repair exonuclease [Cytobacillus horneckiae]
MKRVTFIHAADLHLDSPMVGLKHLPQNIFKKLRESTFESFSKLINIAMMKKVDFLILAGDLFDAEDRSIRAQTRFHKEMEKLAEERIPVFAVHGNHDHIEGEWAHLPMPGNVHIFSHQPEMLKFKNDHLTVHLYGFSYPERHVHSRMIDDYQKVNGGDFHIGILHGHFEGSSNHGNYAPFRLVDLKEKAFDYWALGHIHKRAVLSESPPIIYSGNIQGRNKKETGRKGCYLVELTESGHSYEFIETESVIWDEMFIDASAAQTFHEILIECRRAIEEVRQEQKGVLLKLIVENITLTETEKKGIENGELLEILQDEEKDKESFVWIFELDFKVKVEWNRTKLGNESEFFNELFKQSEQLEYLDGSLSTLYSHPTARRYIDGLSEDDKKILAEDAENLLMHLLIKSEVE